MLKACVFLFFLKYAGWYNSGTVSSKPCWVSSIGQNVKINIFGTHLVTNANVSRKNPTFFYIESRYLQILSFIYFLKSKLLEVIHFSHKKTFSEQCIVLHFRTYHEFKFMSRFRNKYGFCNIPAFGNDQQFKPKHMFIIIEYQNICEWSN